VTAEMIPQAGATPLGLTMICAVYPGVGRRASGHPRALGRNPVGIQFRNKGAIMRIFNGRGGCADFSVSQSKLDQSDITLPPGRSILKGDVSQSPGSARALAGPPWESCSEMPFNPNGGCASLSITRAPAPPHSAFVFECGISETRPIVRYRHMAVAERSSARAGQS
jgi:hypothetical protein